MEGKSELREQNGWFYIFQHFIFGLLTREIFQKKMRPLYTPTLSFFTSYSI